LEQLRKVLRSRKKELLALDNVIGIGAGHKLVRGRSTGRKAIIMIVERKLPPQEVRSGHLVPPSIDGIETDVIETGKIRFLQRTGRHRPAMSGVSIGHYLATAGTFGAVVTDNVTGRRVILGNNHVLANATSGTDNRAKIGDPIIQPGAADNGSLETDVIGELLRFIPVRGSVSVSQCPVAQGIAGVATRVLRLFKANYRIQPLRENEEANLVDCAIAMPKSDDLITSTVMELGEITGTAEVEIGQRLRKSGRTTGLTAGWVRSTDLTIQVDMGNGSIGVFEDQIMSDMQSKPGDSSSVVLDEENRAVGLLFAGSDTMTIINRFSNVMELLDVSL
jgi:hypothetical protein